MPLLFPLPFPSSAPPRHAHGGGGTSPRAQLKLLFWSGGDDGKGEGGEFRLKGRDVQFCALVLPVAVFGLSYEIVSLFVHSAR